MSCTKTIIETPDHYSLTTYYWPTSAETVKGYIHILHGMAEHSACYSTFASHLNHYGYHVIAHDHRGHGNSPHLGHYSDDNGHEKVRDDIRLVQEKLMSDASLPLYVFGHSMGSFIAQSFAIKYGDQLAGLILSGSNYQSPLIYKAGQVVAKIEKMRIGQRSPSQLMDFLSFGAFNDKFKPTRTDFDWLSKDDEQVDQYILDPLCGFPCSPQLWIDLFNILIEISNKQNLAKIPSHLPIYLFAGDKDPVGQMGKGVPALNKQLSATDHSNVTMKLYENGRHEMLNEINAEEVFNGVTDWLTRIEKA